MIYIQGGPSGGAIINGGPNPTLAAPLLTMTGLTFSNPISLVGGFVAPDLTVISCPYSVTTNPNGVFFLQGAISGFASQSSIPGANDWFTLPVTPVPTILTGQNINGQVLPGLQPATFRLFAPQPGALFLRVGYAPASAAPAVTDTWSVYAVSIANNISRAS